MPQGMQIEQIQITEAGLFITVVATHPTSCCPLCSSLSSTIHSTYNRMLQDVPCGGRQVQLAVTVRKFFCRNSLCSRKIFTERLPQFVKPWARMTIRLVLALQAIGLATSGNAGTRLAERLSIQTSRQTMLRRIMDIPPRPRASVLYLGLDDFAFRRGHRYGTICVDLESHQVIDVLPDRRAETVARWMRQHPDIFVVSRDRGGEYASAATLAAPQAIQIADRFHLYVRRIGAYSIPFGERKG
ncbi:MAG TPA: ISL3 family transposase [Ktedonobacteraceae bacterium]